MIQLEDVIAAHRRIRNHIHRTPVVTCRSLDEAVGVRVFLKAECFQKGGSFKVRGATNAALSLTPEEIQRGIVSYSSGNHAQGVALAARTVGASAVIVMPEDAPRPKRDAVVGYGAQVHPYKRHVSSREEIAHGIAKETGRSIIPPFDDERIMSGQGTLALELMEQTPPLDLVLIPVGGGGLISGCSTVLRRAWPECRIYGVEPEAADDGRRSLEAGYIVTISEPDTIADGLRPHSLGDKTFPVIRDRVDGILTVTDTSIARALLFLMQRAKLVIEPSGAVGVAALMSGAAPLDGARNVGVVLSGGNLDPSLLPEFLRIAES